MLSTLPQEWHFCLLNNYNLNCSVKAFEGLLYKVLYKGFWHEWSACLWNVEAPMSQRNFLKFTLHNMCMSSYPLHFTRVPSTVFDICAQTSWKRHTKLSGGHSCLYITKRGTSLAPTNTEAELFGHPRNHLRCWNRIKKFWFKPLLSYETLMAKFCPITEKLHSKCVIF